MRLLKLRKSNREAAKNAKKTYKKLRGSRFFAVKVYRRWI